MLQGSVGAPLRVLLFPFPYATVFATLLHLPLPVFLTVFLSYCLVLFACFPARAAQIHPKFNLIALRILTFLMMMVYSSPLAFPPSRRQSNATP